MEYKYNILIIGIIAAISVLFTSCVDDEDAPPTNTVVLVYMGGDNSLSAETYEKIEALRQGWNKNLKGKLVVYSDPSDAAPQLIEICTCKSGNPITDIIKTYEEENSAASEVFSRVISEVKSLYPAPSYGLILFSHASGWLPERTLKNPKSVLTDGEDEMSLIHLASAMPDNCFDYIIFEACFMSGIEVAYELKNKTNYILASSAEIVSPGFTNIYSQTIKHLYESPANLKEFAQSAFSHFDAQTGFSRSATLSLIRTSELNDLSKWVKNNCDLNKETDIKNIQHFDRYTTHRLFFDFEDYYSSIIDTDVQKKELTSLLNACVVYKAATPSFMLEYNGFEIKKHSGLTTYITQEKFPFLNNEYQNLKWYKDITNN